MVSAAWRALGPLERAKFEEMSRQDKLRYESERRNYFPPKGTKLKKTKDPNAPKRPMSAYLMYANKYRAKVRADNPFASNGETSKILSTMWKELPGDERKRYKDHEQSLWKIYREKTVIWQTSNGKTIKGKMNASTSPRQNVSNESTKNSDHHSMGSIEFSSHVDNVAGVDEPLLGLGSVAGVDINPNTDEIMAASALRGVRGGPQQHFGVGSGDPSQNNGYNGFLGGNSTGGMQPMLGGAASVGQTGYGQMDMSAFPYNQIGYSNMGGNTHAMIMAQLRGNSQQFPGFMCKLKVNTVFLVLFRRHCIPPW